MQITHPVYYVVRRDLSPEEIAAVQRVLLYTPVYYAFVVDALDAAIAIQLATEVVHLRDEKAAVRTAKQIGLETGAPALLFGDAVLIDAVYADGRKDPVPCRC